MNLERKKKLFAFVLILPALIVVSLLIIYPLLQTGLFSFQNYNLIGIGNRGEFIGFENYLKVIKSEGFINALKNTVIYSLGVTVIAFILALGLALLVNSEPYGKKIIRPLVLLPWAIPIAAVAMVFLWIFNPEYGIINYILHNIGLISEHRRWVTEPKLAMYTIMFASIWTRFPFIWLMLLAGLQNIPEQLYEAARVDGANKIQNFFYITLPSISNIIGVVSLVTIIWNFQMFTVIWIMTKGGPINRTTTFSIELYKNAFHRFDFGLASALGYIWLIGLILFSAIYMKVFISDEE